MREESKKVVCAMSGGVDSAVAAGILKNKGYNVMGLFLNMHKNCDPSDAKKVAKQINIPLKILNVRQEFRKRVIDYFIKEYKEGKTPNPCVECNRWIKFGFLIEKALGLGAEYVATGHYARAKNERLFVAKDKQKDQSYFLWTLTQKQLKKILFPIGDYTKKEVRRMAEKWDLPVFEKKDSQEICFVNTNLCDFLKKYIKTKRGSIITTKGDKIGEHDGLIFYTIGQRKGIGVGGIGPFYVVDKDFKNNALIVAKSEQASELYKKEMIVKKVNWISGNKPKLPLRCRVKIRYLHPAIPATVFKIQNSKFKIQFNKPQRAITSGQSAVFYSKNEILGGGVIV